MLKKITIKNFKAIRSLTLELTPLTVLIGENSSGKSTVLQALDFLCSTVSRDIDEYLKDRDWEFEEIKSQFAGKGEPVSFEAEFELEGERVTWRIYVDYKDDKWVVMEDFVKAKTSTTIFSHGVQKNGPWDFSQLNLSSSILKIMDEATNLSSKMKIDSAIFNLKSFLTASSSFELLSPERMRSNCRGKVDNIGMGGEKLAAFIHAMPSTRKNELSKLVSEYIGYDVKISTTTKGAGGWVEMFLEETWKPGAVKVKKRYISDGLLRIIAFSAILVSQSENRKPKGFHLLDEIEDGINPALAEDLLSRFKGATEAGSQFVVTSHSPVMVNYAEAGDIQYMWRDTQGGIHARPLFASAEMRETLDFLNPGEVWLNYSKEDILKKLAGGQND